MKKKTKGKNKAKSFACAKGCKEMCMSCEIERIRNRHR